MSDIIRELMSETLIDAVRTARRHGGELVRRAVFRGSWTWRGCPHDKDSGRPVWDVTDTTISALLKRGFAIKTHTRDGDRPAVVRVKSEAEMPLEVTADIIGGLENREPTADERRGMRWWNSQSDIGKSYWLARCHSPADAWARFKQSVAERERRTAS